MLTIEKVIILKSVEIFQDLADEHLVNVAGILARKDVHEGERILREGDLGTSMFIIVNGKVRVHRGDREIAILGSGEVFGEMAALDPEPRSASVTAVEETLLFELDGADLYELMADHIEVVRAVTRVLVRRVRSALGR
jgi:CRP/FNR family transcriptional regulator, cyclic AMP receptor protein